MSTTALAVYTVSELTTKIRASLECHFLNLWVEGEVSNLRTPSSGHLYFTLKDDSSQIRAVVFRATASLLKFDLRDGFKVVVKGRISLYEPRGNYQVIVEYLEPKGIGALQIAFEQLKERLEKEGLFDPTRKRNLPFLPHTVGVVTSQTGAAIRDILAIIRRRCPIVNILIYPVAVQGEGAGEQIAEAIRRGNYHGEVDVLIVGRGGGSWEDLWCFNEEAVVRAIVESSIPVVSAVGHEIDITLADFAADYRASTPSAAAEAVVPILDDLKSEVYEKSRRIIQAIQNRLAFFRHDIRTVCGALSDPRQFIDRQVQKVDDLDYHLKMAMKVSQAKIRPRVLALTSSLMIHSPQQSAKSFAVLVPQGVKQLHRNMNTLVRVKRHKLQVLAGSLHVLSPFSILSRGYSIIERSSDGKIVKSANLLQIGDRIRARMADGQLSCLVEHIKTDL